MRIENRDAIIENRDALIENRDKVIANRVLILDSCRDRESSVNLLLNGTVRTILKTQFKHPEQHHKGQTLLNFLTFFKFIHLFTIIYTLFHYFIFT